MCKDRLLMIPGFNQIDFLPFFLIDIPAGYEGNESWSLSSPNVAPFGV